MTVFGGGGNGRNGEGEIDSSNNYEVVVSSGEAARKAAEIAARKFASPGS